MPLLAKSPPCLLRKAGVEHFGPKEQAFRVEAVEMVEGWGGARLARLVAWCARHDPSSLNTSLNFIWSSKWNALRRGC